jgi:hypothetical protein
MSFITTRIALGNDAFASCTTKMAMRSASPTGENMLEDPVFFNKLLVVLCVAVIRSHWRKGRGERY